MPVNKDRGQNAALAEELGVALREAGRIALRYFRGSIRSWTKGHDSPVSEADIAVDDFLRERLSRLQMDEKVEEWVKELRASADVRKVRLAGPPADAGPR